MLNANKSNNRKIVTTAQTFLFRFIFLPIGGFHVTSSLPCWWTKTKDLLLASFVRPAEVALFFIVIGVSGGCLKISYYGDFTELLHAHF